MDARDKFIQEATGALVGMYDNIARLPSLGLGSLDPMSTVLVVVDMVNGFTREGVLASPRVAALVQPIGRLMKQCRALGIAIVAFADCHPEQSPEFSSYPRHCLVNSTESHIVSELRDIGGYILIAKNSTNGFLEPEFDAWLRAHESISNFVVVGNCSDICVLQFALSIKAYFNRKNLVRRVIIPASLVDTFDAPGHPADLWHVLALNLMIASGIEVYSTIDESREATL